MSDLEVIGNLFARLEKEIYQVEDEGFVKYLVENGVKMSAEKRAYLESKEVSLFGAIIEINSETTELSEEDREVLEQVEDIFLDRENNLVELSGDRYYYKTENQDCTGSIKGIFKVL